MKAILPTQVQSIVPENFWCFCVEFYWSRGRCFHCNLWSRIVWIFSLLLLVCLSLCSSFNHFMVSWATQFLFLARKLVLLLLLFFRIFSRFYKLRFMLLTSGTAFCEGQMEFLLLVLLIYCPAPRNHMTWDGWPRTNLSTCKDTSTNVIVQWGQPDKPVWLLYSALNDLTYPQVKVREHRVASCGQHQAPGCLFSPLCEQYLVLEAFLLS